MNAMFCPEYVRLRWLYEAALRHWGQIISVSEIEFCTLYVVAEPWILDWILRFMHATNHLSDTLSYCRQKEPNLSADWPVKLRSSNKSIRREGRSQ
jgi:hypothetical protein